jgi:(p)ppGpp synthase/HD superfamily hydrolase
VIEVEWGSPSRPGAAVYPVDVSVEAADRQGLLRDISEVFAKEKMNVIGVQTQSVKGTAWMTFTVEVPMLARLRECWAWWQKCRACDRHAGADAGLAYTARLERILRRVAQLVRAPP